MAWPLVFINGLTPTHPYRPRTVERARGIHMRARVPLKQISTVPSNRHEECHGRECQRVSSGGFDGQTDRDGQSLVCNVLQCGVRKACLQPAHVEIQKHVDALHGDGAQQPWNMPTQRDEFQVGSREVQAVRTDTWMQTTQRAHARERLARHIIGG